MTTKRLFNRETLYDIGGTFKQWHEDGWITDDEYDAVAEVFGRWYQRNQ